MGEDLTKSEQIANWYVLRHRVQSRCQQNEVKISRKKIVNFKDLCNVNIFENINSAEKELFYAGRTW